MLAFVQVLHRASRILDKHFVDSGVPRAFAYSIILGFRAATILVFADYKRWGYKCSWINRRVSRLKFAIHGGRARSRDLPSQA